jgi:hypothetical protein
VLTRLKGNFLSGSAPASHLLLAVALVLGSLAHATVRRVRDQFDERVKRARLLRRLMRAATTYEEWRGHAEQLEKLEGEDKGMARKVGRWACCGC